MKNTLSNERLPETGDSRDAHTNVNSEDIVPFPEEPRIEPAKGSVDADKLFSLFTANIIKEKTLFTR